MSAPLPCREAAAPPQGVLRTRGQDVAGRATSLLGPVTNLWLAGGSRYLRMGVVGGQGAGEEVGRGAIEVVPVAVVAPGGAGVGVAEGVLDVLEGGAEGEGFGGEGVAQAVRGDVVGGGTATARARRRTWEKADW